jgi:hypothetical protein
MIETKESFDPQIDKMVEVLKTCALAYAIATKRPSKEYIQTLISRLNAVASTAALSSLD